MQPQSQQLQGGQHALVELQPTLATHCEEVLQDEELLPLRQLLHQPQPCQRQALLDERCAPHVKRGSRLSQSWSHMWKVHTVEAEVAAAPLAPVALRQQ